MQILNAEQIRAWDQFTIQHEPISSIDLMERAASKCLEWLDTNFYFGKEFVVFCGKGNNGGDGLALARLLLEKNFLVAVFIIESESNGTADFQFNLKRLREFETCKISFIRSENDFPNLSHNPVVIDAIFGSGLRRPLDGIIATLVNYINNSSCEIIAIDIPTGLSVDQSSKNNTAIKAAQTLSFQCYKLAFLMAENSATIGKISILNIGLDTDYLNLITNNNSLIDADLIGSIFKKRNRFSHKGNFGHALLIAGSYGKMGASVLASKACLRSGVGLLSCHIPKSGYEILQTAVPEAMVFTDCNSSCSTKIETDCLNYDSIGIGPGIGIAAETKTALNELLRTYTKPIVLDADALNILATDKKLLTSLPPLSILTPHPKEFERLFGETKNDFERIELASQKAMELNCVIILKGHHTLIATADGKKYFNSTGNAGMATAGSGDVLTGILTGLLAQGYSSTEAAILGVYLHGLAGDYAADKFSQEALIASDIIFCMPYAFKQIANYQK